MTKTMKRIKIKKVLVGEASGKVLVKGWVRTVRHGKQISFIQLNDGSCLDSLQIIVEPGLANYETEIRHLTTGAAAGVQAIWFPRPAKVSRSSFGPIRLPFTARPIRTIPSRRSGTPSSIFGRSPISGPGRTPSGRSFAFAALRPLPSTGSFGIAGLPWSIPPLSRPVTAKGRAKCSP